MAKDLVLLKKFMDYGYINVPYIFQNLQSLSIWTREVKSIAAFSVHDILSGMYLGLLHKIENVYKHSKENVLKCSYSFYVNSVKIDLNHQDTVTFECL